MDAALCHTLFCSGVAVMMERITVIPQYTEGDNENEVACR